jgi:hypothetical protein
VPCWRGAAAWLRTYLPATRHVATLTQGGDIHAGHASTPAVQADFSVYSSAAGDHAQRPMYAYVTGAAIGRSAAAAGSQAGAMHSMYTAEHGLSAYSGASPELQALPEDMPSGTVLMQMVGTTRPVCWCHAGCWSLPVCS